MLFDALPAGIFIEHSGSRLARWFYGPIFGTFVWLRYRANRANTEVSHAFARAARNLACRRSNARIAPCVLRLPGYSSPAAIFTVSARITVLNTNPRNPCSAASRRSLRAVIATSETWNVIPSTSEKYRKSM